MTEVSYIMCIISYWFVTYTVYDFFSLEINHPGS